MTSSFTSVFTKTLGSAVGDAVDICTLTSPGTIGVSFHVLQSSSKTRRSYRVNVPNDSSRDWKRLAPLLSVGKFADSNVWAVDILSVDNVCTLRLVRTSSALTPVSSTVSIKLFAYATAGEIVTVQESNTAYTNVDTQAVYEGALVAEMDGNVGVNNDNPQHTLDVTGNLNVMKEYKIQGNSVVSATTLGASVLYSNLQRVGNLQTLVVTGNVAAPGYALDVGGDINFTGNLLYAGNLFVATGPGQGVSDPKYMAYGRTESFTYTGVGASYTNPLPFYTLLQRRGAAVVTSGGTNANVFTFLGSGTFAVQVEVESGYPWFPEGDITTYFWINNSTKVGVEHHMGGASFQCTRSLIVDISVGDTLAFVVDSIVGNEYEAAIETCRIRFTKIEAGGGGAASFNGVFDGAVQFTALSPGVTNNLLFLNSETGNVTYGPLSSVDHLAVAGNVSAGNLSANAASVSSLTVDGTNLTTLLAAKENVIAVSTTSTYFRGDKTFQTLNTTAVSEGTNLYYTDARARTATVAQTITDGVTTSAPSQDAVFDALALKSNAADVYTKTQLDAGQLDNRYYTETEVNSLLNAKAHATNAVISGTLSVSGNVTAGNLSTNAISATTVTGTLQTASQPNITSVGTLSTLNISGNVAAGNLSTNAISATAISTTGNVSAGNVTVSGKLNVNGAEWASTVIYGTTTPFIYTGPGSTYGNGVPFYAQTATQGTPFVTASGTSNSIFTFVTAGTYMLQSEIQVQFPWMPDGDTNTFYLVNGNASVQFGSELHVSNRFRCSRPFLLTASASDNVRFIIDSSSGKDYEVGLSRTRITILKLA